MYFYASAVSVTYRDQWLVELTASMIQINGNINNYNIFALILHLLESVILLNKILEHKRDSWLADICVFPFKYTGCLVNMVTNIMD